jgi:hypothetical protein
VLAMCRDLVTEWTGAFDASNILGEGIATIFMLAVVVVVLVAVARRWRATRSVSPRDCLTILLSGQAGAFAVFGLVAVRFTWFAAFLLSPVLARGLSHLMGSSDKRADVVGRIRRGVAERTSDTYVRVIALVLLLGFIPLAVSRAWPHATPLAADAVAALPADCHLFSTDVDANAVLLLRPDVKVWIDGRTDMWGRARLIEAKERFAGRGQPQPLPAGTTCVLVPAANPEDPAVTDALVTALQARADWTVIVRADDHLVWVPVTPP